ncbi:MAG: hypothetical protein QHH80_13340 [Anaerolineae bacterium]|nr:hypothetical protein [Anaerolineae bacterium]
MRPWYVAALVLVALMLVGCGAPAPTPTPANFTDPFAYCAAVGTIDQPDARYTGPKVPESVAKGLQIAMNVPDTPLGVLQNGSLWRCMDGKVYACFVGANLPCEEKADTSRTPAQEMKDFCAQNQNADVIPAAVTGRATVYEWRCTNGEPAIVKQVFEADARGFLANFWYTVGKP